MFLAVVLGGVGFQAYAQIDILTQGGPAGSTETLVFKIVAATRTRPTRPTGAGHVLGLFGVTLVSRCFQYVMLNRRVHYGEQ